MEEKTREAKEKYICRKGDYTETDLNNVLKVMFLNNYKPVCMSSSRYFGVHVIFEHIDNTKLIEEDK